MNTSSLTCVACTSVAWADDAKASHQTNVRTGYRIVQCRKCGLRRIDPMPSQDELRSFYEDSSLKHEYLEKNSTAYIVGSESAAPFVTERLNLLAQKLGKTGRILDIGAAQGAFLTEATQLGWDCMGLELSAEDVELATGRGLLIEQKTLHEAALPPEHFDVVHMSHVLEHLPDPTETLIEIYRILRPGGIIAIEVPNEFDDLFGDLREKLMGRVRPQNVVATPHVYFYTPATLAELVHNTGFAVFHKETPRRNASIESRYPLGASVRKLVFSLERSLRRGPVIEVYGVKS